MSFLSPSACSADDRETPAVAVADIGPVLAAVANSSGCALNDIHVYDPYYCKGAIKRHITSLGCSSQRIHNDPVDCYIAQKNKQVPPFDVLVSNPPYSADHIQRCIHYAVASAKPWMLLLPSNVVLRPWFKAALKSQQVMYIAPHERYGFECDEDPKLDSSKSSGSDKHVPFVTMWFVGGLSEDCSRLLVDSWATSGRSAAAALARTAEELPRRIRKLLPFVKV